MRAPRRRHWTWLIGAAARPRGAAEARRRGRGGVARRRERRVLEDGRQERRRRGLGLLALPPLQRLLGRLELLAQQRELGVVVVVLLFRSGGAPSSSGGGRGARAQQTRSAAGRAAALSKPSSVFARGDPLRVGFASSVTTCVSTAGRFVAGARGGRSISLSPGPPGAVSFCCWASVGLLLHAQLEGASCGCSGDGVWGQAGRTCA